MRYGKSIVFSGFALALGCDCGSATTPKHCDGAKLAGLVNGLKDTDARTQRDNVATQLGEICKLPEVVARYIKGNTRPVEDRMWVPGPPEELLTARERVCVDAKRIWNELVTVGSKNRARALYDRCELGRYDLVGRAEFTRQEFPTLVPFYLHDWMVDDGVPAQQAATVAKALALLSRREWPRSGQTIPGVATALAPLAAGDPVYVTKDAISFQFKVIVSINRGEIDRAAVHGHLIGPLHDAMAEAVERARGGDPGFEGQVLLVADAKTPFGVVLDVLYTSGRADYQELALVAETSPLEYGSVSLKLPRCDAPSQPSPVFVVRIEATGLTVAQGADEPTRIAGTPASPWDLTALAEHAAKFKKGNAGATEARVWANEAVSYATFVAVIATLRGAECEQAGHCVLPDISIGTNSDTGGRSLSTLMTARNAGILGMLEAEGRGLAPHYKETGGGTICLGKMGSGGDVGHD